MNQDVALLQSYAQSGDELAFRELVQRHLPLVFGTALRQLNGDRSLAEDVAQTVFMDLARQATVWNPDSVVAGWLYRAARFAAAKAVRSDERRRERELAYAQSMDWSGGEPQSGDGKSDAATLHLDDAIGELGEADRDAIVLRFFQSLDFRAIGTALATSDDTAQKRVSRALEKLRGHLSERGVALSVTALSTLLTESARLAPPPNLVTDIVKELGSAISAGGGAMPGLAKGLTTVTAGAIATALVSLGFLLGWQFHRLRSTASPAPVAGLVSLWTGDGHARDTAGALHAVVEGNVTYAQGIVGQAFQFDGRNGTRLVVPDDPSLNLADEITVACWFRADEDSLMGNLLAKRDEDASRVRTGNAANYGLQLNPLVPSRQWGIAVYYNDVTIEGGYHLIEPDTETNRFHSMGNLLEQLAFFPTRQKDLVVLRGRWHHLAGTFKQLPSDGVEMAIYFDGEPRGRRVLAGSLANARTRAPLCIGGFDSAWFKGRMDEIRLYRRALADGEIVELARPTRPGRPGGVSQTASGSKY